MSDFIKLWPSLIIKRNIGVDNVVDFNTKLFKSLMSNNHSFKFDSNSINWDDSDETRYLKGFLNQAANDWMDEANVDALLTMSNSWINVSGPMQGIPFHNNHNSELVAMYFVTTGLEGGVAFDKSLFPEMDSPINTPLGAPKGKNGLVLNDPRGTAVTLSENGFKLFYEIEPEQGLMVLFPSYIPYYMLPNVGKNVRVVLTCNFEVE